MWSKERSGYSTGKESNTRLNQEKKDCKKATEACGREFVLDEEEHLE